MKKTSSGVEHNSEAGLVHFDDDLYALTFNLMKVTPADHIIASAIRDGIISEETTIVETTSGTLGLGLALVCHHYGLRLTLVSDGAIRGPLLERIRDLGAEVEIVEPRPGEGIQKTRLDRLHRLMAASDTFCPHQYDNPKNAESYEGIGAEVARHLPDIGRIVGPVGSGGSLCGLTTAIRREARARDRVRAVAVDTPGSTLFGLPDRPRGLRGLGNSLHPKNLQTRLIDAVYWVTYTDAANATRTLHARTGIYAGPTSGAAYLAAANERRHRTAPQGPIVFVCPDRGDRYPEVYSDEHIVAEEIWDVPPAGPRDGITSTCWSEWGRRELDISA